MSGWLVVTVIVAAAAAVVVPLLNQPVERPSPATAPARQVDVPAKREVGPLPRSARVALGCLVGVLSLGLLCLAAVSPFGQDPCGSESEAFFCANSQAVNIVVTLGVIAGFVMPLALSVTASFTSRKSQFRRDWMPYCAAIQVCAGFAMLVMTSRVS